MNAFKDALDRIRKSIEETDGKRNSKKEVGYISQKEVTSIKDELILENICKKDQ